MQSRSWLLALLAVLYSGAALADHPLEGNVTLRQLLDEAAASNKEVQQAAKNIDLKAAEARARFGAYLPELSLGGGPQAVKLDENRSSGTAFYAAMDWNLYRGGSDRVALERSRLERGFAERELEFTKARVSREVAQLYYALLFLEESIALNETALKMNAEQMKLAQAKRSAGFTSNADVLEFDLREATLRSDLQELFRELSVVNREMGVLLGHSDASPEFKVIGHLTRDNFKPDVKSLEDKISASNPEIVAAEQGLKLGELERDVAKAGYLPSVNLDAQYGRLLADDAVYRNRDNFRASLQFKLPLFSGLSTKNSAQAASSLVEREDIRLSQKRLEVRSAAENAIQRIKSVQERLDLEERTLTRSEEYYKLTLGEYRRGVKNSPDMVGAAERLVDARRRNLQFRKEYQLAKLEILALTGEAAK
jgi:outer membrane protein